jgi:hypothetical protein
MQAILRVEAGKESEMNSELAIVEEERGYAIAPLTDREVVDQVQLIQRIMRNVMKEGIHYGTIPGTDKPTLYKAGAEKLCMTFRLAPKFQKTRIDLGNEHIEYEVCCVLSHIPTGIFIAEGLGSCSTRESKYRYRQGGRQCPKCGAAAIIKGQEQYGGGWLCFAKKGGCGAKFADTDAEITSQPSGKVENPDIADTYNPVLKIAKKRALVDATLTATAASDIFYQDLEDYIPPSSSTEERPLITQAAPHKEEESRPDFQAGEEYAGTITALIPKTAKGAGRIEMDTDHGHLTAFFFSRPEVLKQTEDWEPLIGAEGLLSFAEKPDKNGNVWRHVDVFDISNAPF